MSKSKQRTGVFDLDDAIATIRLNPLDSQQVEDLSSSITVSGVKSDAPRVLVDATEIKTANNTILIDRALLIVKEQMKLSGLRKVTINEYVYTFNRLINEMDLKYLDEITLEVIFEWLSSLGDVSNVTKQSRLRVLKAVLNRFYDNGWYRKKFWKDIKVKVDNKIKPPADEQQLSILLSLLDMSNFIQYRDAVAILTMYKTGIRMNTLIQLEEKHIDFDTNTLLLTGDIMKNHDVLKLPFDNELENYLKRLIEQNNIIRKHYSKRNKIIFIGKFGDSLDVDAKPCAITKRLSYYAKKYGLSNINAHAIRRLYATNLRKKGADVVLISKALHHKSLATTTQYLGISSDEVVKGLREFI